MSAILARAPRWFAVFAVGCTVAGANVAIGLGTAAGQKATVLALAIGLLPALLIAFGALVESHRATLAWAALALNFTNIPAATQRLPLPGGTSIFPVDVLVLLAIGAWLASRLSGVPRPEARRLSPIFGWPLALVAVSIASGVIIGHERYGASYIAQPFRLVLYAGIALAVTDVDAASAWRAITRVFYAGAILQSFFALYYLATGTSQTDQVALSTGGVRVLALSVAIYLTGSLVCALLNLELEHRPGRQFLHVLIAGLALFGIVVAFGRTTYAAVVLIVPLLLVTRRYMRRTVLVLLPLLAPVLVLVALLVPTVAPTVVPTLQARLSGTSSRDDTVVWRERAREVTLEGVDKEWLTGVGFGRVTQFRLQGQVVKIDGDPHNSYVYLLAGGGVLALGSFLLLCGLYLIDALRRLRRAGPVGQALVLWSLSTWLAFMVNALAGPIFPNAVMMMTIWILMALPSLAASPSDRAVLQAS